ncbi:hypothetical protein CRI94_08720 [Longibacter salinarum]|uniref:DUF4440 domain-containing protein n=2 Tax=Longibacter salinarum TaxID=1850348 RepID=A0A2A8CYH3_9BACT|nr:hypothetical protein CRI94_08720 [Longibacter salinarum]
MLCAGTAGSAPSLAASPEHGEVKERVAPRDTAEAAVRGAIEALFDGMRAGDASAVREAFHDDARLFTATADSLRSGNIESFAEAVGSPRDQVWDERTYEVTVDIDGPMASAWVPYAFYLGDELSHCGVNAVQLVKGNGQWKILQLVDTRRTECDLPDSVTSPDGE